VTKKVRAPLKSASTSLLNHARSVPARRRPARPVGRSAFPLSDEPARGVDSLRLERELAAHRAIGVTLAEPLGLNDLLQSTLETILKVMEADQGWVWLLNEATRDLRVAAHRGLSPVVVQETQRARLRLGEGLAGRVAASGEPITVNNVANALLNGRRRSLDEVGAAVCVPLHSRGRTIGVVSVATHQARRFTPHDIELLVSLGHLVGAAIEKAQAREKGEELRRQLQALNEAAKALTAELSLDILLQKIVDLARELVSAKYAALGVPDGEGGLAQFLTSGISAQERRAIGAPPRGHGLIGLLLREPKPLRVPDIASDRRAYGFPPHHPRMTSFLGVPILSKGVILGNLYLTDKEGADEFSEDDERLVIMLAAHAAIAIENARLYEQSQHDVRLKATMLRELGRKNRELERVNEKLKELDRLKSEFVSLVSHELRAPLTNIQGAIELLLQPGSPLGLDTQRNMLEIIGEQSARLNRLVQGVLNIARIESGKLVLHRACVDMGPMIQHVVQHLGARTTQHRFEVVTAPELPQVWGDRDRVEEILTNLVDNAIKYSPHGGDIVIRAFPRDQEVVISVADSGVGIAPAELSKLFEKFHRVDSRDAREIYGHGLGLYICRKLVEAHGGRIWAESEPGRGSIFSFTLPQRPPTKS